MNADHAPRPTGGWPNDENRPVFAEPPRDAWWRRLGLAAPSPRESATARAHRAVLASLRPQSFVRRTDAGEQRLSLDDVVAELDLVTQTVELSIRDAADERRRYGWERVRAALSAPDASVLIADGPWAGFTHGRAAAWCWNLFQYEPHGFISPGAQVRAEALRVLEAGGLPNAFGYPARATELERAGLTPESYRQAQEALGKPTFSPDDVRR